jgi:hypothetical protein
MGSTTTLIVLAIVMILFFLLKRSGQISAKEVPAFLKDGALVIDVPTPPSSTPAI